MIEIKLPKGEVVVVRYYNDETITDAKTKYIISFNPIKQFYTLWNISMLPYKKIAKGQNPIELEKHIDF